MKRGKKVPGRAAAPATIRDVASELGMSVATVSRALSQPELLRPETRDRVLSVVAKLGYRPNVLARSRRRGQTHAIVLVVPLFLFFVNLGLVNSRLAVILIYTGLLIPFSIYLLVNFFVTIPRSLEEAARIDGAGSLRVLIRVVVPLSAPSIVTVVVVNTVWVWNELLIALVFLQDDNARTLTAGLTFFQGRFQSNEPLVMTGALIATIPMLALYIIGQRFFIRGLSTGFGK